MKTCEQVAADVLARRDAYLEKRAVRRRQAKRYTVASLLVCAAVFAAAGLFRSGLFNAPPPSVYYEAQPTTADNALVPTGPSGTNEAETKAKETTAVPRAVGTTQPAKIDLSGTYVFPAVTAPAGAEPPTEEPGTVPTREQEPEETASPRGAETVRPPETTTKQQNAAPTAERPEQNNAPTKQQAPAAQPPATDRPGTTVQNGIAGTAAPTDVSETTDAAPAQSEDANCTIYATYVTYNGALYLAEGALPVSVPTGTRVLEQKDALLYDETLLLDAALSEWAYGSSAVAGSSPSQPEETPSALLGRTDASEESEPVSTRITLLALPGASAGARIGVTSEGLDGKMFVLEYYGMLEELIQEETQ